MFGIGGWEFVLIAVLALLLFGPDRLPQFARTIGRFMRDFKRYQDLMESTIRGEIFAADPNLKKDPFDKGKEFRERVAGGGFAKPAATTAPEASADEDSTDSTGEDVQSAEEPADSIPEESPESAMTGEIALDEPEELLESAMTGEIALDDPEPPSPSETGEGEPDEA